jgi:ATP-dependent DNA helicase RecG
MSPEMLQQLLAGGESPTLEFKSAAVKDDALGAIVCAFLNTNGGTVVVGAHDDGCVDPVADAPRRVQEIQHALQGSIHPNAMWSVVIEQLGQDRVILIEVPAGDQQPYVFADKIYLRRKTATEVATVTEISRMILARQPAEHRWERMPALGVSLEELDTSLILETAREATTNRFVSFTRPEDPMSILEDLNLARNGAVTNGAVVLFAKNPTHHFPQARIRAAVFADVKTGEFIDNKDFQGNAFAALEKVEAFLRLNVRIGSKFPEGSLAREDRPTVPWNALREGVMNALVHRDYAAFTGGMSLGIYPDRIEIWNSGQLPPGLSVKDLANEHPSLPQNPDIAHVFFLRRLIERWGRGTRSIVEECVRVGLPPPTWRVDATGVTLTYFTGASSPDLKRLNARQRELASRLKTGERITPAEYYAATTEVSQRQLQRDLAGLASAGVLRQEGDGPATVYVRTSLSLNPDKV